MILHDDQRKDSVAAGLGSHGHNGVPLVDVSELFQPMSTPREATDAAILQAAGDVGFLSIAGLPEYVPIGSAARAELLRIFA